MPRHPAPDPRQVGREIRVQMARHDLTAKALAERAGVNAGWLTRRLSGAVEFTPSELAKIAGALNVDWRELLHVSVVDGLTTERFGTQTR